MSDWSWGAGNMPDDIAGAYIVRRRTWFDRLFSWPWDPWRKMDRWFSPVKDGSIRVVDVLRPGESVSIEFVHRFEG